MKYLNEDKLLQSMKKFAFIVYFSSCCIMFILIYIYPIFLDLKINGLSSLVQKETPIIIAKSPSESINYFKHNWIYYINPFSNSFVRFFIITAVFGCLVDLARKSYKSWEK